MQSQCNRKWPFLEIPDKECFHNSSWFCEGIRAVFPSWIHLSPGVTTLSALDVPKSSRNAFYAFSSESNSAVPVRPWNPFNIL
eukprot:m.252856 g.252856  ORF g.252856 m.252856 type:complete len:83 (+) comp40357_c0_seq5:100-348(+)